MKSFKPLQSNLSVHLRISIVTSLSGVNNQTIYFYNSYNLIEDLGIDCILLNKSRISEYQRSSNVSKHFVTVFENKTITISEVL